LSWLSRQSGPDGRDDQTEQVGVGAADQRERGTLILGDGLAALTGLGFNLQGDIGHFDGGLSGANLEGQVDALAAAYGDGDIVCDGLSEAGGTGGDGIDADAKGRDLIVA
jgi:hypothetical protein